MVDLAWYPFYEIGHELIDDDHRRLLTIMQAIQSAVIEKDYSKCAIELDRMMLESKLHFAREETFLAKAGYPHLDDHIVYHHGLLVQAERIRAICQGTAIDHDLNACFEEMTRFLIDDVLRGDLQFKSYLEDKGLIKPSKDVPPI